MSEYPISFRSISMDHQSGTKSYHLVIITNKSGKSVFINRWGKKGAFGEIQVAKYPNEVQALKAFQKKERLKASNGYRMVSNVDRSASDADELRTAIGMALWSKIGREAIAHIDPDLDVSDMRLLEDPKYDENGKLIPNAGRQADLTAQIAEERRLREEQAEAAKAAELAVLAQNPKFGRF